MTKSLASVVAGVLLATSLSSSATPARVPSGDTWPADATVPQDPSPPARDQ